VSATLRWRLFLARTAHGIWAGDRPRLVRAASWLTPATACALLTMLVLNSENATTTTGHRRPFNMAMMSNQNYAVYATSRQCQQNNLSLFTFDWTNGSDSGSTLRFMPFRKPTD
jgi:hypothetical protein